MSRYRVNAAASGPPPPPPPPGRNTNGSSNSSNIAASSRPLPPGPPLTKANINKLMKNNPQDVNNGIGSQMSNVAIRRKGAEIKKLGIKDASKDVEWASDLGHDLDAVKFAPVQIKDKFALSLFILQLLVLAVLFVIVWSDGDTTQVMGTALSKTTAVKVFGSACGFAIVFSGFWLMLLKIFINKAVIMTFAMAILILGGISGIAAHQGQIGWAIFWGVILFIFGYYFYLIRKRIKFATLMLKAAIDVVLTSFFRSSVRFNFISFGAIAPLYIHVANFGAMPVKVDDL